MSRWNDEIDKMGIWSKANTPEYDNGYEKINGFGKTRMELRLEQSKNDNEREQ